jgi:hypothetical protein
MTVLSKKAHAHSRLHYYGAKRRIIIEGTQKYLEIIVIISPSSC